MSVAIPFSSGRTLQLGGLQAVDILVEVELKTFLEEERPIPAAEVVGEKTCRPMSLDTVYVPSSSIAGLDS